MVYRNHKRRPLCMADRSRKYAQRDHREHKITTVTFRYDILFLYTRVDTAPSNGWRPFRGCIRRNWSLHRAARTNRCGFKSPSVCLYYSRTAIRLLISFLNTRDHITRIFAVSRYRSTGLNCTGRSNFTPPQSKNYPVFKKIIDK